MMSHGRPGRQQSLVLLSAVSHNGQPIPMSHAIDDHDHDHDHDHPASSTSLMGIDTVAPADDRAGLLDVERDSAHYGSTKQSNGGPTRRFISQTLFFTDCSLFHRTTLDIPVNGCKKSQVLHTLLRMVTELFLFTVRFPQF